MKSIRIQNLRNLVDTGEIKITPITLLIGQNNSGKSTFLKSFPLLKQSFIMNTNGPISWVGFENGYVDFGSFSQAVHSGSDTMRFTFKFHVTDKIPVFTTSSITPELTEDPLFYFHDIVEYSIDMRSHKNTYVSKACIKAKDANGKNVSLQMAYNENGEIEEISFDDNKAFLNIDHYHLLKQRLISLSFYSYDVFKDSYSKSFGFELPIIDVMIADYLKQNNPLDLEYSPLMDSYLVLCGSASMKSQDTTHFDEMTKGIKEFLRLNTPSQKYEEAGRLSYLMSLLFRVDNLVYDYFLNVHYIAPIRATAQRFYRIRNYATNEVDYQGKNLAEYLYGLPDDRLQDFHEWTQRHFHFEVSTIEENGIMQIMIQNNNEDSTLNLCDVGFGFSQVLPILVELWSLSSSGAKATFVIEQPELHLHPALQGKLLRAMASIVSSPNNNLSIIMETHSKTMIEALGALVYRKKLDKNLINVVLFEKETSRSSKLSETSFDDDGYLNHWPLGFLDDEI